MENIKRGTTREVILIGRLAIKFATFRSYKLFLCGILGNIQEAHFYRSLKSERDKMCPVLFCGPLRLFIVMKRAKESGLTNEKARELSIYYNLLGIPVEGKPCSFGIIKGKMVAIDYGS